MSIKSKPTLRSVLLQKERKCKLLRKFLEHSFPADFLKKRAAPQVSLRGGFVFPILLAIKSKESPGEIPSIDGRPDEA